MGKPDWENEQENIYAKIIEKYMGEIHRKNLWKKS